MKRVLPIFSSRRRRTGFSLVEILIAVMILGVGMIMVASVFPVGANWARQNIEETIGSIVAQNAVNIIKTKYSAEDVAGVGTGFEALPLAKPDGTILLPLVERAYSFGNEPPYPAANPESANYFWSAVVRRSSSSFPKSYDLYIFVFRKGGATQSFTASANILPGSRENSETVVPYLETNPITDTRFSVGSQGVGTTTGSVFRKIDATGTTNIVVADTQAIYAPPADDSAISPLVYIYTTTISF